jgi:hypothetical protein
VAMLPGSSSGYSVPMLLQLSSQNFRGGFQMAPTASHPSEAHFHTTGASPRYLVCSP